MLPKIQTILYATALGPGAPYVFRYALHEAEKHGAKIVVLHVMEPLTPFGSFMVEQHISHEEAEKRQAEARDYATQKIQERVQRLCDMEAPNFKGGMDQISEIRVIHGQPHLEIVSKAREMKADLIVIGSHRHTAIGEMLGHTATRVAHRAEIPVLVVRIPEGYHEEGF